jgi:hypothetical protein
MFEAILVGFSSKWRWRGRCSGQPGSGLARHLASRMSARVHRPGHGVLHGRHGALEVFPLARTRSIPPLPHLSSSSAQAECYRYYADHSFSFRPPFSDQARPIVSPWVALARALTR